MQYSQQCAHCHEAGLTLIKISLCPPSTEQSDDGWRRNGKKRFICPSAQFVLNCEALCYWGDCGKVGVRSEEGEMGNEAE